MKVGDPMPDGYIARAEWAQVHLDAGLKEVLCCKCVRWWFPHQLSKRMITTEVLTKRGKGWKPIKLKRRICKECDSGKSQKPVERE